jgi:hypothetical protein
LKYKIKVNNMTQQEIKKAVDEITSISTTLHSAYGGTTRTVTNPLI